LAEPELQAVRTALKRVLDGHEPYPAAVVNRWWELVDANAGIALFTGGVSPELLEPPANVVVPLRFRAGDGAELSFLSITAVVGTPMDVTVEELAIESFYPADDQTAGPGVTPDRLGLRALNRAALHRQLLLDRAPMAAGAAVRHLAGLQAQAPLAPYVGLWTRLAGFRPQELKDLFTERAVLRAHLMRNTVHLVDAGDYVRFRPLYQPLLARHLAGN